MFGAGNGPAVTLCALLRNTVLVRACEVVCAAPLMKHDPLRMVPGLISWSLPWGVWVVLCVVERKPCMVLV